MPVPGVDFTRILFFGDSLTDNGNLYGITGGTFPTSPPYAQRFSNGETYAELLPGLIGVASADVAPTGWTFGGDDNFAYGGGRAITNTDDQIPDLATQLFEFSQRYPGGAPDGSAALLLVGNNDYFNYNPAVNGAPNVFIGNVLAQVAAAATTLATTGNVDKIILLTLPNVAATPLVALNPASAALDGLIDGHNAGLRLVAAQLAAAGINVEIVDNNAFVREIAADAETFGFLAPLSARLLDAKLGVPNAPAAGFADDEVAFWDDVHPTAAAHGVTAAFTAASIAADTVTFSTSLRDVLSPGAGNDVVFSGAGNDRVVAGSGNDVVFAGTGNDVIVAGTGNDVTAGGSGNDIIYGGGGVDVVAGNVGNDVLNGGGGNDVIIAGRGNDLLIGWTGNDRLYVTNEPTANDRDFADGGTGFDTLVLEVSAAVANSAAFKAELARYDRGGGVLDIFEVATFNSIGLVAHSIERVEVVVAGTIVATAGDPAPATSADQTAAIATADLWGLI